jgi:beta-barrel assembly-enhancing protease
MPFVLRVPIFLVIGGSVAASGQTGGDSQATGYSRKRATADFHFDRDSALGRQLALEIEMESKVVYDRIVSDYVNRIGQYLARDLDTKFTFTFRVIDSKQIDAFALPGGFIFVTSGALLNMDSEAELAGVLAQEIGRAVADRETRQTHVETMRFGRIGLGTSVAFPSGTAGPAGVSRAAKAESNLPGVEYMYRAGYNPGAYATFTERIQRTEEQHPGTVSKFFSTGSPADNPIRKAQADSGLHPTTGVEDSAGEFGEVKARVMALDR